MLLSLLIYPPYGTITCQLSTVNRPSLLCARGVVRAQKLLNNIVIVVELCCCRCWYTLPMALSPVNCQLSTVPLSSALVALCERKSCWIILLSLLSYVVIVVDIPSLWHCQLIIVNCQLSTANCLSVNAYHSVTTRLPFGYHSQRHGRGA